MRCRFNSGPPRRCVRIGMRTYVRHCCSVPETSPGSAIAASLPSPRRSPAACAAAATTVRSKRASRRRSRPITSTRRGRRARSGASSPWPKSSWRDSSFSRVQLKKRLYAVGLKQPVCEMCGQGELWRGRRLSLILDHANGMNDDHRLENLRILCPNCAATLETHCGRNVRHTRECATCGAQFRPGGSKQRYCSQRCGSRSAASRSAHEQLRRSSGRRTSSCSLKWRRRAGARSGASTACRTTLCANGWRRTSARGRARDEAPSTGRQIRPLRIRRSARWPGWVSLPGSRH